MRSPNRFAIPALGLALALAASVLAQGGSTDWPQWRGPDRTGLSKETGLLKTLPAEGPKQAWKATGCGLGYTTPSIAGGKVFGMGNRGDSEIVWALDAATGKEAW